ncbi:ABC transporter ATP-binding protein [Spirillospora albida]|uniref:ABC transporter ATP-binding protein n=1 Tax=Spirillospora albida TaxID=58123 RepID=UPI00055A124B|nr:oligopeptide/dipeptide ABC transporter ATP-binding protein [Spirillospora albida]
MTALLSVRDARVHFPLTRGVLRREIGRVRALDGVTLDVAAGETLGIVGESGCGKSTLARCVTALQPVTAGRVLFEGTDVAALSRTGRKAFRRDVQIVFQDPYGSLNPRRRVGSIIADPLAVHRVASGEALRRRVRDLMDLVGLDPSHADRFPAEFSGGQRQRVAIARAIALRPRLLVCDEPVSALDASVQAQILNLLRDLRDELGLTIVFIAHDLPAVRYVSDRVAVMYLGRVVELAAAEDLHARPRHPYTAALLAAAAATDPAETGPIATGGGLPLLQGEPPSPAAPPPGCGFHPRCPRATPLCRREPPPLISRPGAPAHLAACHHVPEHAALPAGPEAGS